MAEHRAETIMDTVATALAHLATSGSNVARGRYYPWPSTVAAALELWQGQDEPLAREDRNIAFTDSWLTLNVDAVVRAGSRAETTLNKIRREVTVALLADYTQGLGYVLDTVEGDTAQPEHDAEAEQPTLRMRMQFQIKYRRSVADPSTN